MTEMTEKWAILWYQCLSENYDYSMYADARVKGNAAVSAHYEQKFEKIAAIYKDFGRLTSLYNCDTSSPIWREWFEPRKKLFMPDVRVVVDKEVVQEAGKILLSVPLQRTAEETVAAVALEICRIYEQKDHLQVDPPRYKLYKVKGQVAHGYEQVRQAVITSVGKKSDILNPFFHSPTYTMRQAMTFFLKEHIDELGWGIDEAVKDELLRHDRLDDDSYENFKARINKSRREFRKLARNVIWGSFPDMRPFESVVWDRFRDDQSEV